ncbi:FtsX-like permease family protein [Chakrabartia godavariana]|nr:FtsX-like permease family protein [Chakrabartia godavariana]
MSLIWRLALRDLRGSRAGLRLLAVCLFLGVAALAGIGSLSSAILGGLSERGQLILGGDVQFEAAQRQADPAERAAFAKLGTVSEVVRMRAMAIRPETGNSLLSELKGVDAAYPLYGQLTLQPGAVAARPKGRDVAIAQGLSDRLGLKPGDRFRMGEADFRVIGIIDEEPDRSGSGFTFGPAVLADMDGLAATQLVQPGSLFSASYRIRLKPGVTPDAAAQTINTQFKGAGWEVRDRSNGAPGTRRFVERLGQFLALVGLTALAVAGIGVGNGVASWLDGKRGSIATMKVLGADSRTIFLVYLVQIVVVAGLAVVAGLVVGALTPFAIVRFAGDVLPVPPRLDVYPLPLAVAAVNGLLIALLFALPPLARARAVTAANLFRTGVEGSGRPGRHVLLAMLALAALIAALAIASAREPAFAAMFVASVIGLLVLLTLLGGAIRGIAARAPRPRAPLARLALANLHRPGAQTGRLVVALGLGLTLFATLAVIQTSLNGQIESTIPKRAPSFFALDIPKEDAPRFRALVDQKAPGADIQMVPNLRGPVVAIAGRRVADMKDIPDNAWFLRGDRGLTFATDVPPGSRVTAGQWWPRDYAGPPLVSIDQEAAHAAGLKIGDSIIVSVLGVEVEARIASLREINWDTLGFNYVLVFDPASLQGAPYTYAATLAMPLTREAAVSRAVAADFPAVSMVRIKDVITQVGDLLNQLATAIAVAGSVAILAGIAVLIGAIAAARRARSYDAVLLKLLGATRGQVLLVQAIEYAVLGSVLSALALAIGSTAGWYVTTRVFELDWTPDWPVVIGTVAAGGFGTLLMGLIGAVPVLRARPAEALRTL